MVRGLAEGQQSVQATDAQPRKSEPIGQQGKHPARCQSAGFSTLPAKRNVMECSPFRIRPPPAHRKQSRLDPLTSTALVPDFSCGTRLPKTLSHWTARSTPMHKTPPGPQQLALCEDCQKTLGFRLAQGYLGSGVAYALPSRAVSLLPLIHPPNRQSRFLIRATVCNACFSIQM